jgi:hypothetical protein
MNAFDYEEFKMYVAIYNEYLKMDEDGLCEDYIKEQFEKLIHLENQKLKKLAFN